MGWHVVVVGIRLDIAQQRQRPLRGKEEGKQMKRTFWLLTAMVLLLAAGYGTKQTDLNDAEAYNNRGNAYFEKGQHDQAISDYNKALEINPTDAGAYNNRGIAYMLKGKYDKAWEDVHKAQDLGIKIHPGFLKALRKASERQK